MRNQRGETKLAVLNCVTNELKGFEGRRHCQTVIIDTDEDTTAEFMREAIEEFRVASDTATAIEQEEQEKKNRIISEKAESLNQIETMFFNK